MKKNIELLQELLEIMEKARDILELESPGTVRNSLNRIEKWGIIGTLI